MGQGGTDWGRVEDRWEVHQPWVLISDTLPAVGHGSLNKYRECRVPRTAQIQRGRGTLYRQRKGWAASGPIHWSGTLLLQQVCWDAGSRCEGVKGDSVLTGRSRDLLHWPAVTTEVTDGPLRSNAPLPRTDSSVHCNKGQVNALAKTTTTTTF